MSDMTASGLTSPDERARLRARLLARAKELGAEVRRLSEDFAGAPAGTGEQAGDEADRGAGLTHDLIRHAEQDRDADELAAIDDALARLDEGLYGLCVDCDAVIPEDRLAVQPAASRCIGCQERHEREHPAALRDVLGR